MAGTGSSHHPWVPTPLATIKAHAKVLGEIDDSSWLLDRLIISRHSSKPPSGPFWDDGEGGFFTISDAPNPPPETQAVSDTCPIIPIFYIGGNWGTWRIGLCELRIGGGAGTREHVTLESLEKGEDETTPWTFQIPRVYYHACHDDTYYIAYSVLPGKTLCEVWPKTEDEAIKERYARQIAQAYWQLSTWRGENICGVDGRDLLDLYLCKGSRLDKYSSPQELRDNSKEIGMDCSDIVFAHNNMRPHSFSVDDNGLVGISGWESAGYVPRDWVRTKTCANALLPGRSCLEEWSREQKVEWHEKINRALEELKVGGKGFGEKWPQFHNWNVMVHEAKFGW
ncbi:hypothetical protein LCI18_012314 [Fusarium solani-melongenae]|uniref:Uncharacterized protein n=1 Tax=Fusarium solani subsp. cucurbitae TaxID=2747967 RepID=A0ACD3ZJ50_FUSSC|nr:hypothetical protein LCI18_012314 [Fusarium solani-melongenae]